MRHRSRCPSAISAIALFASLLALPGSHPMASSVAVDPGPRPPGPSEVGGPLPDLTPSELALFTAGQQTIQEIDSVQGALPDTGLGLGPRFNMDSCAGCHNYPAPGGTSPPINPQVAVATKAGATNTVPFFITSDGPIRHAHILDKSNGSQAHLFTITGRSDASGCTIAQPDFQALAAANNLAFHSPLQLYGTGLMEAIDGSTLIANLASNRAAKQALGISGHPGLPSPKLGRFGFKAQGDELLLFAAGAYAREVGVTNVLVPNEDDQTPGCQFNQTPEDVGNPTAPNPVDRLPDFAKIAGFATFSAPPSPVAPTPSTTAGKSQFVQIGCALCHTPALPTSTSATPPLNGKTANLYSDLALHNMGPGLADGQAVGNAGPDEIRTTPLWGLGLRLFLLHDGRTRDLVAAINAHASAANATYPASEANAVIGAFNALSETQQQDILNFLRSL
jgi:CxxC motif-containing protein (DUF1111 family)